MLKTENSETYKGYKIFITLHPDLGHRNGYVVVNKALDKELGEDEETINHLKVHGGITFTGVGFTTSAFCDNGDEYIIGFDCNHYDDCPDYLAWENMYGDNEKYSQRREYIKRTYDEGLKNGDKVRDLEFVKKELYSLIDQIIELKEKNTQD